MHEDDSAAGEVVGDAYPEIHLCVSCLAENLPTYNFCHDCGAPIDFCATTVPFQEEWALGWVYRAAVAQPNAWSIPAMTLGFASQLFTGSVSLFGSLLGTPTLYYELGWLAVPFGLWSIGIGLAGFLVQAANYVPKGPESPDDTEADPPVDDSIREF